MFEGGCVTEVVRSDVVERRGVEEAAVAVECQGAVSRAAELDRGEDVAIDVAVVGQHAGGSHGRSEERRVGEEGRSRGWPYHYRKKVERQGLEVERGRR